MEWIDIVPVEDKDAGHENGTLCPCGPDLEIINGEMLITHDFMDGRRSWSEND